jgi:hypothetical protein
MPLIPIRPQFHVIFPPFLVTPVLEPIPVMSCPVLIVGFPHLVVVIAPVLIMAAVGKRTENENGNRHDNYQQNQ